MVLAAGWYKGSRIAFHYAITVFTAMIEPDSASLPDAPHARRSFSPSVKWRA